MDIQNKVEQTLNAIPLYENNDGSYTVVIDNLKETFKLTDTYINQLNAHVTKDMYQYEEVSNYLSELKNHIKDYYDYLINLTLTEADVRSAKNQTFTPTIVDFNIRRQQAIDYVDAIDMLDEELHIKLGADNLKSLKTLLKNTKHPETIEAVTIFNDVITFKEDKTRHSAILSNVSTNRAVKTKDSNMILNKHNSFANIDIKSQSFIYPNEDGKFEHLSFITNELLTLQHDKGDTNLMLTPSFKIERHLKPKTNIVDISATDEISTTLPDAKDNINITYI